MTSRLFAVTSISASGMSAERQRMELVANNIANANSTGGPQGLPYQRRHLLLAPATAGRGVQDTRDPDSLQGVRILGTGVDQTPFPMVHMPGHPHADAEGMVQMPNVNVPVEMVDLIAASRSYEANLKALTLFREMVESALTLIGGRR